MMKRGAARAAERGGFTMLELATLIPRHARFRPDSTAVLFEGERLTYAQFGARVAQAANALRSQMRRWSWW
jgi:non-ribosomal peptide synthetase component E (peptide arylation enzyme)